MAVTNGIATEVFTKELRPVSRFSGLVNDPKDRLFVTKVAFTQLGEDGDAGSDVLLKTFPAGLIGINGTLSHLRITDDDTAIEFDLGHSAYNVMLYEDADPGTEAVEDEVAAVEDAIIDGYDPVTLVKDIPSFSLETLDGWSLLLTGVAQIAENQVIEALIFWTWQARPFKAIEFTE
jgi:hypothetical protein